MQVFLIVIGIVFALLIAALIALGAVEAVTKNKRERLSVPAQERPVETAKLHEDSVLVRVERGSVILLREEKAPAAEPQPEREVVEPYDELAVATQDLSDEQLGVWEALKERYGAVGENTRVIEVDPAQELSFAERLAGLDPEIRSRYEQLKSHILEKESAVSAQSHGHETFKYRSQRLLRAAIRREGVVIMVRLPNTELSRFVREEGIKSVKVSPVTLRLDSDEELAVARQTADIAAANIDAEFEYRRARRLQQRRERQAQLRAQARESENQ